MVNARPNWQEYKVSEDQTHHLQGSHPAYAARFLSGLKVHAPGLAPAADKTGAFHINISGEPAYSHRFMRTFGFYEGRAAVQSNSGHYHILADGSELYPQRYTWCGNFQEGCCVVKDFEGRFFHINLKGERIYPQYYRYVGDFHDGYAVIRNERGLHTHINAQGFLCHGQWFIDLDVYHKGFARAKDKRGSFHINLQGKEIYSQRYKNIGPFYNGIAHVETYLGAIQLIDEKGEITEILREATEDEFHQLSGDLISYWRFYTLQAAHELNLFDHLPNSTRKLSELLLIPEMATLKLLRALQEIDLVFVTDKGDWMYSTKGEYLTSSHPSSLKNALALWKDEHLTAWSHISHSLKTGTPSFDHLYGKNWFIWLKDHPEKNQLYHHAIGVYARRDYQAFCERVDMSRHSSVIDVGGSQGVLLVDILNQNTHLKGFLLDLPHVAQLVQTPPHLKDRMQVVAANFFEDWPDMQVDSAVLSRVLHDWGDEDAIRILKKVHSILSKSFHARVYIIENLLDETSGQGALLDLNMLIMTGGTERTLKQFKNLLNPAGFDLETTYPLNQVSSILVARRR